MMDMGLAQRTSIELRQDPSRVLSRLFIPGQELVGGSESRAANTVQRVLELTEDDVQSALDDLFDRFQDRHEDLAHVFDEHADRMDDYVSMPISAARRRLIGAAFSHEYSIEGAAVCNPSLVLHPDQSGMARGDVRFAMSVRAVGEGHHSSICFRTGSISNSGEVKLESAEPFPVAGSLSSAPLNGDLFHSLMHDLGFDGETTASVLDTLPLQFSADDLETALARLVTQSDTRLNVVKTASLLRMIAACTYQSCFDPQVNMSRRVLWPAAPNEGNGMEDARFVEMRELGVSRYIASYTAFDGHSVSQQLLETNDFLTFTSSPLAGRGARNKGLAFFPRKIGGRFAALSRFDRESNAIAYSDDLHRWNDVVTAQVPFYSWEVVQLGNCGSPIELPEGWLVMTHGVGPMRTYGISALLLDLEDPTRIIGQLARPLLTPSKQEQNGYVPNVVYSCGSLVHQSNLFIPYGIADQSISVATVSVASLLDAFEPVKSMVTR
ncbi:MAG: glycosidase [Acidimicrobiaceae bacterium]|nr:glycosidase [Acidimicrobiaceae bacterium]